MLFELEAVAYRYGDGTPALDSVSFSIDAGERIALLGANGSGKSTLLRLMDGLLFPDSGTIRFNGVDLTPAALKQGEFAPQFRQQVGFVFQDSDAQLFNATVLEETGFGPAQLGLSPEAVEVRARETLAFLGIAHLADRPPFRLSGGEKRKVALASVLSMNPKVLLFDEPFLGLDPRSQVWLLRTLEQLHQAGKTLVIATHSLEILPQIADRAIVLSEEHRLVADGACVDVLADRAGLLAANLIAE